MGDQWPACSDGGADPYDDCGICHGGNANMDCNGECAIDTPTSCQGTNCGTAVIDDCGVCTLGTTGIAFNQDIDCNGECLVMLL